MLGFKLPEYIVSSPFIGHTFEINRRFVYVMRVLGLGLEGCKKFCSLMDMSAFLSQNTYDMIIKNMKQCVIEVTEKVLSNAEVEEKKRNL